MSDGDAGAAAEATAAAPDAHAVPAAGDRSTSRPRIAGRRVTDASAVAGGVVWLAVVAGQSPLSLSLGLVEPFVALAVLAFVPLGLGLAAPAASATSARGHSLAYDAAVWGQFPAALSVVGALALPVGSLASVGLALPWLGVTGAAAVHGLARLRERGLRPLPALAVDAALLYVPVGAVALLLHRAGISLRFDPTIVLLTVVHYHYAGFVLPLVAGLAGRRIAGDGDRFGADRAGRIAAVATLVIVANLALIAVGITFSPLVEVVAVAAFTAAVAAFALLVLVRVVPTLPPLPAALLGTASLAIVATMALALAYGYSAFPATGEVIGIGRMIRWHGTLNAVGFALPALLTFRILDE